jgi:hypothetical protein
MHPGLCVDEIVRLVAHGLVAAKQNATAVALACCCKRFEDPVLDVLWRPQFQFSRLLETLPGGIWRPDGFKVRVTKTILVLFLLNYSIQQSFKRLPTTQEWARLWKYARRMRMIYGAGLPNILSSQVLSILQFRALSEPLLPNLKTLELWFDSSTQELTSFIPLFLSTRTTSINLALPVSGLHKATVASMIASLPTLCPNLHRIHLTCLPTDSMIVLAVSELVFNTEKNALRSFYVDSPLTEEASEVICKRSSLRILQIVINGSNALPTMELPNLTNLRVGYYYGNDWLQGFRGASLGKLTSVEFFSESVPIDNFLGAFETVALTTSIPATLLTFEFHTKHPWRPSFRSLLPFIQLKNLTVESSCGLGCSSTIDDDTVTDLARALPKLETLQLGDHPCETPAGVTVKGLSALARYCPNLIDLVVHFQVATLDPPEVPSLPSADDDESTIPQMTHSASLSLHVGQMCVPDGSDLMIALTLLRIFPRLEMIEYSDEGWEKISEALYRSKKLTRCLSKEC